MRWRTAIARDTRLSLCITVWLVLGGCVQRHPDKVPQHENFLDEYRESFSIHHASQFKLDSSSVTIFQGAQEQQVVGLTGRSADFPLPLKNVACLSTTALPYFEALDALDAVAAVGYFDRIIDPGLKAELDRNRVTHLDLESNSAHEALLSAGAQMILCYPFGDINLDAENTSLPKLYITEYLEDHPLGRAEWLKLFGVLLGKADRADSIFNQIELAYDAEMIVNTGGPSVFFNLPFKERWYMPPAHSVTSTLAEDAGLEYVFSTQAKSNLDMSREEVLLHCTDADVWVIVADRTPGYSMSDLIAEDPSYGELKAVKTGRVVMCNTRESDFFGKGVLEPHVMLKELKAAIAGKPNSTARYFRLLR